MRYHNAVIRRLIAVSMACLLSIGFAAGYHADYSMAAEATDDTGAGELATDVLDTLTVKGRAPSGHSSVTPGRMSTITDAIHAMTFLTVI